MINQRLRFSILHRDRFTCRYCGVRATHRKLEVDHFVPVSKGGRNDRANLVTACIACNKGKSNMTLATVPSSVDLLYEQAERCIPAYHPSPMDADVSERSRESALVQEHCAPPTAESMATEALEIVLSLGLTEHLGIESDSSQNILFMLDTPLPVRLIEAVTTEIHAWPSLHRLHTADVTDIVWAALETTIYLLGGANIHDCDWPRFEQTMCIAIGAVFSGAATAWGADRYGRDECEDGSEPMVHAVHQVDTVHPTTGEAHRLPATSVLDFLGYARVRIL